MAMDDGYLRHPEPEILTLRLDRFEGGTGQDEISAT